LSNGLGLGWSLGGDGVLESLSRLSLGVELFKDGAALTVGGELVTNGLQVTESGVQGGLEALDVAGDTDGVSEG